MKAENKVELHVVGTHLKSEAYPNVQYRINDFKQSEWLTVTEINQPMWKESSRLQHSKCGLLFSLFRAIYAHLSVITKYLSTERHALVYVPYPAVFVGLMLAILPRYFRPRRIVLDAFISLYDTVVNDRKLLSHRNWLAIILKSLEYKAYAYADYIIVDTPQSAKFFCQEFDLLENKVVDIPLSINENVFQQQVYLPDNKTCRVLFIGTFIPLHGVSTILAAAALLKDCGNIQFQIVGSGQTATEIKQTLQNTLSNVEWIPAWQTSAALADLIAAADICLGIFGDGEKAQRVCPFKLYMYAACGKAIISGDTEWARFAIKQQPDKPFETAAVNDSVALANQVKKLAESMAVRQRLAEKSNRFYQEQLSNKIALAKLELLFKAL